MNYKFYKNEIGWFIDLPNWKENIADLQLVANADVFFEELAAGNNEVFATLTDEEVKDAYVFSLNRVNNGKKKEAYYGGAFYDAEINGRKLEIWLCDVTKFIFTDFPNKIYIKKLS